MNALQKIFPVNYFIFTIAKGKSVTATVRNYSLRLLNGLLREIKENIKTTKG